MLADYPSLAGLPEALLSPPDVSVRLNAAKGAVPDAGADVVPWCPQGIYLTDRPAFTFDPTLHQGLYYVQDASSMILDYVARRIAEDKQPLRWLDACAAPGGKSTAILSALPEGSLLVANEFVRKRAAALMENLERWGFANVAVTCTDTEAFTRLPDFFDVVSVDAPCSGEGMMRKEAVAVSQWSPALVQQCAQLQREIVANVWQSLRPGGFLVYSTCTFNPNEDERNVAWIMQELGAESVDLSLDRLPGVVGAIEGRAHCARFLPGKVRGEGLFIAVLQKNGDSSDGNRRPKKSKKTAVKATKPLSDWLTGDFAILPDSFRAVPAHLAPAIMQLAQEVPLLTAGIDAAAAKGRDIIPSYALARAIDLNISVFHTAEVDYATAIAYLRGMPITVPDAPRGIILLTFRGRPLAFAKNIGTRANNLIPDNRLILSPHIPSTPPSIL